MEVFDNTSWSLSICTCYFRNIWTRGCWQENFKQKHPDWYQKIRKFYSEHGKAITGRTLIETVDECGAPVTMINQEATSRNWAGTHFETEFSSILYWSIKLWCLSNCGANSKRNIQTLEFRSQLSTNGVHAKWLFRKGFLITAKFGIVFVKKNQKIAFQISCERQNWQNKCSICRRREDIEPRLELLRAQQNLSDDEEKEILELEKQLNIILRHRVEAKDQRSEYNKQVLEVSTGKISDTAILVIDFKENLVVWHEEKEDSETYYNMECKQQILPNILGTELLTPV